MSDGKFAVIRSEGNRYQRDDGRWLLDFSSGGFGNGNFELRQAIARQTGLLCLSSRNFFNENLALFCTAIVDRLPEHRSVFPCNSFDEALDGALKLAKGARPGRGGVVVVGPAPRSRTFYGARLDQNLAGQSWNRLGFTVDHAAWDDLAALRQSVTPDTYAVVASRSAGVGPSPDDAAALRQACDAAGAVLIANEEETGLGALGSLTSLDAIEPDVFVFGASLGGIVPFATYAARKSLNDRVYKHRDPVLHATTTGGNPIGCVAARTVLEQIDKHDLYSAAKRIGDQFGALLHQIANLGGQSGVSAVTGSHLAWEIQFESREAAAALAASALDRGLLFQGPDCFGAAVLRIRIPLTLRDEEFATGLAILGELVAARSDRVAADA
ncbi:MAG: aminotransferase class III-fold pyridoxal phosphate-dependent enzyme [Novosphingobium sp.]